MIMIAPLYRDAKLYRPSILPFAIIKILMDSERFNSNDLLITRCVLRAR